TGFSASVVVGTAELGAATVQGTVLISVEATASGGGLPRGSGGASVTIAGSLDTKGTGILIQPPPEDGRLLHNSGGIPVTVRGIASDDVSGVSAVRCRLDEGAVTEVRPPAGTLVTSPPWQWTLPLTIPHLAPDPHNGRHTIEVWGVDNVGNESPHQTRTVYVGSPYLVVDPNDTLSLKAYLQDLITYALRHVSTDGSNEAK